MIRRETLYRVLLTTTPVAVWIVKLIEKPHDDEIIL